jgi:hypothetical protein
LKCAPLCSPWRISECSGWCDDVDAVAGEYDDVSVGFVPEVPMYGKKITKSRGHPITIFCFRLVRNPSRVERFSCHFHVQVEIF